MNENSILQGGRERGNSLSVPMYKAADTSIALRMKMPL